MTRPRQYLLLHGPNLNLLGKRDRHHYGTLTLAELVGEVRRWTAEFGAVLRAFQSNHEGELIDWLQRQRLWADAAIVNLGALTHSSYALHDALIDLDVPIVEVHLSSISNREPWRQVSVTAPACLTMIEGKGVAGYREALERLESHFSDPSA